MVLVSDGTESPATQAFSLNGKWLSVYTCTVLTIDPVTHVRGWHTQGLGSFGTSKIPGVAGTDYSPPVAADFDYFKLKGRKVARIGFVPMPARVSTGVIRIGSAGLDASDPWSTVRWISNRSSAN